jgi:hypothetical protein
MFDQEDDSEQGVLSYSEFVRRETLIAWTERKKAFERDGLREDTPRLARVSGGRGEPLPRA